MNSVRTEHTRRLGLLGLIGATGLLVLALATPAEAGPGERRDPHAGHAERGQAVYGHDWRADARRDRHPRWTPHVERRRRPVPRRHAEFVVPRLLRERRAVELRPYYRGRVYSPAHGHYHEVYDFPVLTRWGWERQPHYYCEGSLFAGGYVTLHGPHFDIGVRF